MFLVRNIKLCCNGGFSRFEVKADSRRSDLNFWALFKGDEFNKVVDVEGTVNDIVDGGCL